MTSKILFFRLDGRRWDGVARLANNHNQHEGIQVYFWSPSLLAPVPPGRADPRIWSYSLLHLLGHFSCNDYAMIALKNCDGHIVHSSMIMPAFARFPFMGTRDLQIGATETDPAYRGRGLAVRAIDESIARFGRDRNYWYLTDETNSASISVIRKAGFELVGMGRRHPRYGLRALGYYAITSPAT